MSTLRSAIDDYLALRRQLGFSCRIRSGICIALPPLWKRAGSHSSRPGQLWSGLCNPVMRTRRT